jgi:hypothetical protein
VQLPQPIVVVQRSRGADDRDAGIAEDSRDWAKSLGVIERCGHLLGIRYVGRGDDRGRSAGSTLFCRRLQFIAGQCHEGDGRALLRQSKRRGTADS